MSDNSQSRGRFPAPITALSRAGLHIVALSLLVLSDHVFADDATGQHKLNVR